MNKSVPKKVDGRASQRETEQCDANRRKILKWAASGAALAPLINIEDALAQQKKGANRPPHPPSTPARHNQSAFAPKFFTQDEFVIVDELSEMIIPSDEHSPGARAVGVSAYLDDRLAELRPQQIPEHAKEQQTWRDGLALVGRIAQEMHGKSFRQLNASERDSVLRRMADQEPRPTRSSVETTSAVKSERQQAQEPKSPDDSYREQSRKKPPTQPEVASARKGEGEFFVFLKGRIGRVYYTSEAGMLREMDYQGNRYLEQFVGYDVNGKYTEGPPARDSKKA